MVLAIASEALVLMGLLLGKPFSLALHQIPSRRASALRLRQIPLLPPPPLPQIQGQLPRPRL